jgi:hypothetical protein
MCRKYNAHGADSGTETAMKLGFQKSIYDFITSDRQHMFFRCPDPSN